MAKVDSSILKISVWWKLHDCNHIKEKPQDSCCQTSQQTYSLHPKELPCNWIALDDVRLKVWLECLRASEVSRTLLCCLLLLTNCFNLQKFLVWVLGLRSIFGTIIYWMNQISDMIILFKYARTKKMLMLKISTLYLYILTLREF